MKRFTIPCDFAGEEHPFYIYIGRPSTLSHPLYYQSLWLEQKRGGIVPQDVISSFNKLYDIATENNVGYEDLCVYALGENASDSITKDGNIFHVDFKKTAQKAAKSKKTTKTKNDYYIGYSQPFDLFDFDDTMLRVFCQEFSSLLFLLKPKKSTGRQTQQFAEQILRIMFFLMACAGVGDKKGKAIWIKKLAGYFHSIEKDESYSFAVSADTLGEFLTFLDIAALDYFLRSDEAWQTHITMLIQKAIGQWAMKKIVPQDIFRLGKFGADEKAIAALKKALKTSFQPL